MVFVYKFQSLEKLEKNLIAALYLVSPISLCMYKSLFCFTKYYQLETDLGSSSKESGRLQVRRLDNQPLMFGTNSPLHF